MAFLSKGKHSMSAFTEDKHFFLKYKLSYGKSNVFYLGQTFFLKHKDLMSHACKYDISHMVTSRERQNSEVHSPLQCRKYQETNMMELVV